MRAGEALRAWSSVAASRASAAILAAARRRPPRGRLGGDRAVTIAGEALRFALPFTGGEVIERAGTLLGHDDDRPVLTPYDDCMLVMPSKRLTRGLTAVRLARRVG
ncbi:MAG: hypothetical protein R3E87_03560 [Burkholderiaceae bacterium]